MRIGHFIETEVPGGAEKLVLDICARLPAHDITPVILHFNHPYFRDYCESLNIEQHVVPGRSHFKSTFTLPLFSWGFRGFLKRIKIDVLHSHLFGPVSGAAMGCKMAGIAHVGTLHDVHMIEEKPNRIRLLQLAAFLGTKLVTVSSTMKDFYHSHASFSSAALRSIANGVNLPPLADLQTKSEIRKELGIELNTVLFINVGRLVPLKRHDLLIQSCRMLPDDVNYKVLIVGDGPQRQYIEQEIQENNLLDKVVMTGQREDIASLLNASDCFIQCSDTEGLSMSIMEAMAASLPCIVTDVGGNAELVVDNENGWLLSSSSNQFADKMQQLIADENSRKIMGKNSKEFIMSKYLLEKTVESYVSLYKSTQI